MSGSMAMFIAGLVPYFAFLWALNLLLFNKALYTDYYNEENKKKFIVPYLALAITGLYIVLPIRTITYKCSSSNDGT